MDEEFNQVLLGNTLASLEALGDDPVVDSTGAFILGRVGKSAYLVVVNDTETPLNDMTEKELDALFDRALDD